MGHTTTPGASDAPPRETAGITIRLILAYVARELGDEYVEELLTLAGESRPRAQLESELQWSSYDRKIALFDAAAVLTGRPDVARRIGETVLAEQVGGPLRLLLTALGSPAQVVRSISRANAKFSTTATMTADLVRSTRGVVTYRLHEGYVPSRHDCLYNMGLLSQVPVLFGLPPAVIAHDECQVSGAEACRYELRWQRRRRWWRFGAAANAEVETVRLQLQALQETAAALASIDDVDRLLGVIATQASSAVRGQRYLLAVQLDGEAAPRIHGDGFQTAEAEELGRILLGDDAADRIGDRETQVLVSAIASQRWHYGRLAAFSPIGEEFLEEERRSLDAYAKLAAAALDSTTALDVSRQRTRLSEALLDLARSLAGVEDVDAVAEALAQAVPQVTTATRGGVMLWRDGRLSVVALHGDFQQDVWQLTVADGDTPALEEMLRDPTPRLFRRGDDAFIDRFLTDNDLDAVAVSPMVRAGRFLGILTASWSQGTPHEHEQLLRAMSGLADQGATAIANANLVAEARMRAFQDPLTGLPNRAVLEDRIERALADAARSGRSFALLFLDLDGFKAVNDQLGHAVGDVLLTQIAARLSKRLRKSDTLCRLGGDEFVVLAANVRTPASVEQVVESINEALAEPIEVEGRLLSVRASIGAVIGDGDSSSGADLLRAADAAMYEAKRHGTGWRLWGQGGHAPVRSVAR